MSNPTLETLLAVFEKFPKPTNPFVEMAKKHGCDITAPDFDLLVIPQEWTEKYPECIPFTKDVPGLKVSPCIQGNGYLLKTRELMAQFVPPVFPYFSQEHSTPA